MNSIVVVIAVGILGFALGRLKSMRAFQRPSKGQSWVLVPDEKLPAVLYALDETSAVTPLDRLLLTEKK